MEVGGLRLRGVGVLGGVEGNRALVVVGFFFIS